MATLRDVAERAGVSVGAVSRILANDPTLVIRDETRARVLAAATELRYRPNRLAAGLRTRRAGVLALFLPDPVNLGWADMLRSIESATAAAGYLVAVADVRGPSVDPEVFARYAFESRVDGVLLATGLLTDTQVADLASRGLPLLPLGSRYGSVAASVTMRDADGAALAVEHLIALGHTRVAFVAGHRETDIVRRREAGVREALERGGVPSDGFRAAEAGESARDVERAVLGLLRLRPQRRPSAIVAGNLTTALQVRATLKAAGLRVPEDLSLVTYDDHPVAAHLDPALTCIAMPMGALGAEGVQTLLAQVEGTQVGHRIVPDMPVLRIRASTAPPPGA